MAAKRRLKFSARRSSAKRTRRRRRRIPRRSRISRPIRLFPKTAKVSLTYCDEVECQAGLAPKVFRLNSVHDPDVSVGGHQPRGHDQWSAMYSKYCVIGATVFVEPLRGNATGAFQMQAYIDDDSTSDLYTIAQLRELNMPKTRYRYINVNQDSRGINDLGNPNFSMKVGMKKFFGLSKTTQMFHPSGVGQGNNSIPDGDYQALVGTNPTKECFLKLRCEQLPGGASLTATCRVTINYLVVYYDPKEIGSS